MQIELHEVFIREVVEGYVDCAEEGVFGYCGKLNIRPKYQREFIYKDDKRNAVIDTIRKNFPLNVMYWVKLESGRARAPRLHSHRDRRNEHQQTQGEPGPGWPLNGGLVIGNGYSKES